MSEHDYVSYLKNSIPPVGSSFVDTMEKRLNSGEYIQLRDLVTYYDYKVKDTKDKFEPLIEKGRSLDFKYNKIKDNPKKQNEINIMRHEAQLLLDNGDVILKEIKEYTKKYESSKTEWVTQEKERDRKYMLHLNEQVKERAKIQEKRQKARVQDERLRIRKAKQEAKILEEERKNITKEQLFDRVVSLEKEIKNYRRLSYEDGYY
jgi:hypothetical protein